MYHFIFLNEASIETENKKARQQESTSDNSQKETKQEEKSREKTDAVLTKEMNRPKDTPSIIH